MPTNAAAWQNAVGEKLSVQPAPYTPPGPDQVVIKVHTVAINPVDHLLQDHAIFPWLKYPAIMGRDIAGEIFEVGPTTDNESSRFKPGDRVIAHSGYGSSNNHAEAGFQSYVVVTSRTVAPIPSTLSYENAVVLPLGVSTASNGLFQKDYLALPHPSLEPKPTGTTLIVWGGSSSVGSNAIQLARAAGCSVIATASPRNFDYVKSLGASQVFDYHSPTVVDDLTAALKNHQTAGAFVSTGGAEAWTACATVLLEISASSGPRDNEKFIATSVMPPKDIPAGITTKFCSASALKTNEVGGVIYGDFLPEALAKGKYKAVPKPLVVERRGLEGVQEGYEVHKKGVSARKVVVVL